MHQLTMWNKPHCNVMKFAHVTHAPRWSTWLYRVSLDAFESVIATQSGQSGVRSFHRIDSKFFAVNTIWVAIFEDAGSVLAVFVLVTRGLLETVVYTLACIEARLPR